MHARILIVDDDPRIRKVLTLGLEKAGYEVEALGESEDVARRLNRDGLEADCVLLDIRMPGLSGLELLEQLHLKEPLTPVIMLTANSDLETGLRAMKEGAFDYLVKPARKDRLVETIRKALRYRHLQLENKRLARENAEYQRSLEQKVAERTTELKEAYRRLKRTNIDTVRVLAETIEAKDPYTRGHSNRVRTLSKSLGEALDLSREELEIIEYGALLHDIGKIGVPEQLLHKDGPLTDEERAHFQLHPVTGWNILKTVEFFEPCLPIVRNHHERFDGTGYPDGISGEEIPLFARIAGVADAFDAMTSTRPYRSAMPLNRALQEIRSGAGAQFDPQLADRFLREKVYASVEELFRTP